VKKGADLFSRVYGSQFLALEKQELSAKQAQQGAPADDWLGR
jgi:hypothetical protein